jgi:acyl-CoA synthetase (AMP-forming)/AMP-acid ligase II
MDSSSIASFIHKTGEERARPAIVAADGDARCFSYAELEMYTDRLAAHWLKIGVGHGDVVVVLLTNCWELQFCYFACFRLGAIMQPLNYAASESEIAHVLRECRPRLMVTNAALFPRAKSAMNCAAQTAMVLVGDGGNAFEASRFADQLSETKVDAFPAVLGSDFGQVFFVLAKEATQFQGRGVLLTHDVMRWHSVPYQILGLGREDVVAGVLHPYNALSRAVFAAGAKYVLLKQFSGPGLLQCMVDHGITFFGGTPKMFEELLKASKQAGFVPTSLRGCLAVGGLLPSELWTEFEQHFHTCVYGGIGCKELGIFALQPPNAKTRYGSIGKVLPHMDYLLGGPDMPTRSEGEKGYLWIRSQSIITHYWVGGKPTPLPTQEGWFNTGYETERHSDDYLYLTGNCLDRSVTGQKRYFNIA